MLGCYPWYSCFIWQNKWSVTAPRLIVTNFIGNVTALLPLRGFSIITVNNRGAATER